MRGLQICAGSGQGPGGFGWVNIDCEKKWRLASDKAHGEFLCGNISQMPLPDGSAEIVVASQVYEHLDFCREGPAFLREAFRVLRPGGSLILTVPDAEALATRWLKYRNRVNREKSWGSEAQEGEIDDYIFAVNCHGAFNGCESERHKWLWCYDTLRRSLLEHCQWKSVKRFNGRPIPGMELAAAWWILSLEALR